jgi:hypothetical protein
LQDYFESNNCKHFRLRCSPEEFRVEGISVAAEGWASVRAGALLQIGPASRGGCGWSGYTARSTWLVLLPPKPNELETATRTR